MVQNSIQKQFMTNAINLKSYALNDSDKIILMYSQDKGLIKGVAKGVTKTKSKLGGRMDLLVANKLLLHKGRNLNTIQQAEALNTFYKTRTNMDKMFFSSYCAEIIMNFGVEDDPGAEEIFNLLYNALEAISIAENKVQILLACLKFQLKIINELGYGLQFSSCSSCSGELKGEKIYFSLTEGGTICEKCADKFLGLKKIPAKLAKFFDETSKIDFSKKTVYDDKVDEKFAMFCFGFLNDYISRFSSKKFKSLEMIGAMG